MGDSRDEQVASLAIGGSSVRDGEEDCGDTVGDAATELDDGTGIEGGNCEEQQPSVNDDQGDFRKNGRLIALGQKYSGTAK